jgi:uncharacterized DUF497 family protein
MIRIMVTYDPIKRLQNLKDHGIDFAELHGVLDHQIFTEEDLSEAYGEQRLKSFMLAQWSIGPRSLDF